MLTAFCRTSCCPDITCAGSSEQCEVLCQVHTVSIGQANGAGIIATGDVHVGVWIRAGSGLVFGIVTVPSGHVGSVMNRFFLEDTAGR